jgi:hypothetical protein
MMQRQRESTHASIDRRCIDPWVVLFCASCSAGTSSPLASAPGGAATDGPSPSMTNTPPPGKPPRDAGKGPDASGEGGSTAETGPLDAGTATYCGQDGGPVPIPTPLAGTTILPSDYSTFVRPAKGASYREPDILGTTATCSVQRMTDGVGDYSQDVTTHDYSTQNPFNADDSLLMVGDDLGAYIVRRTDGAIVVPHANMPRETASLNFWDTVNSGAFYFGKGSAVMKGTIAGTNCTAASNWTGYPCTVTTTTLYTSSYDNLQFNENDISDDGLHFWIADAYQDTGTTSHILLITLDSTDAISATLTATVTLPNGYHKLGMMPNNYLYVNGTAPGDALYDTTGALFNDTINTGGGHVDFGYDLATGKIVGVGVWYEGTPANGCSNGSYYGGVGVLNLEPGDPKFNTIVRCLSLSSPEDYSARIGGGWHYSLRDAKLGWIISDMITDSSGCPSSTATQCFDSVQPTSSNWDARQEEIVAWKEDGSEMLRLVHHRSREGGGGGAYWSEPRPTISRDGKYIAFDSNFDVATGNASEGTVDVFVIPFQVDPH